MSEKTLQNSTFGSRAKSAGSDAKAVEETEAEDKAVDSGVAENKAAKPARTARKTAASK